MADTAFNANLFLNGLNVELRQHWFRPNSYLEIREDGYRLQVGRRDPSEPNLYVSVTPMNPPTPPEVIERLLYVVTGPTGKEICRGGLPDQSASFSVPEGSFPYLIRFEFKK
jgi:hypothetical protein